MLKIIYLIIILSLLYLVWHLGRAYEAALLSPLPCPEEISWELLDEPSLLFKKGDDK